MVLVCLKDFLIEFKVLISMAWQNVSNKNVIVDISSRMFENELLQCAFSPSCQVQGYIPVSFI